MSDPTNTTDTETREVPDEITEEEAREEMAKFRASFMTQLLKTAADPETTPERALIAARTFIGDDENLPGAVKMARAIGTVLMLPLPGEIQHHMIHAMVNEVIELGAEKGFIKLPKIIGSPEGVVETERLRGNNGTFQPVEDTPNTGQYL